MAKLSPQQIAEALRQLPEWSEVGGELQRTYQFRDFGQAMRFVNEVAGAAEAADHHPDILVRYNKVTLTLTTHDAGGITEKDVSLALAADAAMRLQPARSP